MNPKTNPSEIPPMFVRWLVAMTVATLAFAFLQEYWVPDSSTSRITPLPWTTAGGIVISQGLEMFQGLEPKEITSGEDIGILLTVLMAFVIGPTMLFFSWRRLSLTPKKSVLSPANIGFFFGALITSFYLFGILVGAIIHPQVASSMRSAQAVGENRDMMIAGISRVALDAYQYRIKPKAAGGGGGSYVGYSVPEKIRTYAGGEYLQSEVNDSTITISGASLEYKGSEVRARYGPDGTMKGPFMFLGKFQ